MTKNLLLLSSSREGDSGYLEHALPIIKEFLMSIPLQPASINPQNSAALHNKKLLFIPYAGVSIGFDEYETMVKDALKGLDVEITSIHQVSDKFTALQQCDGIITGGGNTFCLLNSLYEFDLIEPLRKIVDNGTPYIGWSAGSNIAAPSIRTTNDMPIVEPPSFAALDLIPWQINPHYIDGNPPGHNGETRQQRIEEFLLSNPGKKVIGIAEGTALCYQNDQLSFIGETGGYLFANNSKIAFDSNSDLNQLVK